MKTKINKQGFILKKGLVSFEFYNKSISQGGFGSQYDISFKDEAEFDKFSLKYSVQIDISLFKKYFAVTYDPVTDNFDIPGGNDGDLMYQVKMGLCHAISYAITTRGTEEALKFDISKASGGVTTDVKAFDPANIWGFLGMDAKLYFAGTELIDWDFTQDDLEKEQPTWEPNYYVQSKDMIAIKISFTPGQGLISTNVQDAIIETKKVIDNFDIGALTLAPYLTRKDALETYRLIKDSYTKYGTQQLLTPLEQKTKNLFTYESPTDEYTHTAITVKDLPTTELLVSKNGSGIGIIDMRAEHIGVWNEDWSPYIPERDADVVNKKYLEDMFAEKATLLTLGINDPSALVSEIDIFPTEPMNNFDDIIIQVNSNDQMQGLRVKMIFDPLTFEFSAPHLLATPNEGSYGPELYVTPWSYNGVTIYSSRSIISFGRIYGRNRKSVNFLMQEMIQQDFHEEYFDRDSKKHFKKSLTLNDVKKKLHWYIETKKITNIDLETFFSTKTLPLKTKVLYRQPIEAQEIKINIKKENE